MHGVFFVLQTVNMRMTRPMRSQKKSNNFAAVTDNEMLFGTVW